MKTGMKVWKGERVEMKEVGNWREERLGAEGREMGRVETKTYIE
jgi:hypothetical protein